MKEPRVCIALASYNGAKHIKVQLDSLVRQRYSNFVVVIRDDGSKDNTMEIVKEYAEKYPDHFKIMLDEGANLRCPTSFYRILQQCEESDYYGFCDQDDEWKPDKIQRAVEQIEKAKSKQTRECYETEGQREGWLYLCSYDYCTEDGKFIRQFPKQREPITLDRIIYHSPGSGFTLLFDETIRRKYICDVFPGQEMHDRYLIRCAACFENIVYDSKSMASHIRFADSVTAEDSTNSNLLVHFIRDEIMSDTATVAKRDVQYFQQLYWQRLNPKDESILQIFVCEHGGVSNWLRKLFYPHRMRERISGEIALRILFFIGKI